MLFRSKSHFRQLQEVNTRRITEVEVASDGLLIDWFVKQNNRNLSHLSTDGGNNSRLFRDLTNTVDQIRKRDYRKINALNTSFKKDYIDCTKYQGTIEKKN